MIRSLMGHLWYALWRQLQRIAFGKIHLEKLNWSDRDSIESESLLENYSSIMLKVLRNPERGSMHSGEGCGFWNYTELTFNLGSLGLESPTWSGLLHISWLPFLTFAPSLPRLQHQWPLSWFLNMPWEQPITLTLEVLAPPSFLQLNALPSVFMCLKLPILPLFNQWNAPYPLSELSEQPPPPYLKLPPPDSS